jgi:two-component system nitrate/nitrite response regulator NarL
MGSVTPCADIVIANQYPIVLYGLTSVLAAENDFRVIATCQSVTTCIEAIRERMPDLVLLDMSLPPASGLEVLATINSQHLRTRAIFFSPFLDGSAEVTAIAAGAYGIIPVDATPELLLRSLRKVAFGEKLPIATRDAESPNSRAESLSNVSASPSPALTERQRQIAHLVGEGLSNKEIGRQLQVSEGTIKVHLHRIYQRLAVQNRTVLAMVATQGGPLPFTRADARSELVVSCQCEDDTFSQKHAGTATAAQIVRRSGHATAGAVPEAHGRLRYIQAGSTASHAHGDTDADIKR